MTDEKIISLIRESLKENTPDKSKVNYIQKLLLFRDGGHEDLKWLPPSEDPSEAVDKLRGRRARKNRFKTEEPVKENEHRYLYEYVEEHMPLLLKAWEREK